MLIERTNNEVIIRLSPNIDIQDLQKVLNFARYKELTAKFKVNNWKRNAGLFFSKAIFGAALLDMCENGGMLLTINGNSNSTIVLLTSACSAVKWAIVLLTILYILMALLSKKQVP